MLNRYVFAVIVFVAFCALSLIAWLSNSEGFFVQNLVPELMGVCIELLIILFVFDVWQKADEQHKKIKVERRLREFLIFFLKHSFSTFPPSCQPGRFYGSDHEQNQKALDNLIEHIEQNGLDEEIILAVQSYCLKEREIFNNLISVSSDLENDHFKSWVRIAYFMNAIVTNSEKTSYAVIKILQNIQRFDKVSHDKKLYVGAEKEY
ncbi:membrane protein [Vibrio cholerae]|nr:hypothetical protein VCSRO207_2889 [Vibrio cholerae]GHW45328.1 membrane protein [Vibrio cholerae]GIA75878.1 membrane protein [Vibrio cholerae]